VKTLGYGQRQGVPYMAMEYVEGESLRELIRRRGALPWPEVKATVLQVAKGLAAAHAAGVIHRDVKPSNIMIAADGTVKLADFGVSRALDLTRLTGTSTMLGTPTYMAPDASDDARSDLYSLGVVAYEALAGTPPFTGDSQQRVIMEHMRTMPDLERLPAESRKVVGWLLKERADERPGDAATLATVLDGSTPMPRAAAAGLPRRWLVPILVGGGTATALGAFGLVFALNDGNPERPAAPSTPNATTTSTPSPIPTPTVPRTNAASTPTPVPPSPTAPTTLSPTSSATPTTASSTHVPTTTPVPPTATPIPPTAAVVPVGAPSNVRIISARCINEVECATGASMYRLTLLYDWPGGSPSGCTPGCVEQTCITYSALPAIVEQTWSPSAGALGIVQGKFGGSCATNESGQTAEFRLTSFGTAKFCAQVYAFRGNVDLGTSPTYASSFVIHERPPGCDLRGLVARTRQQSASSYPSRPLALAPSGRQVSACRQRPAAACP
jgi:eukaryotic-like serine/threonine-protein kinase